MDQDALVILWSQDYVRKYWTRIEWKTALAMCKPLVIVQMDDTVLDRDLRRAIRVGKLPVVKFGPNYRPSTVASLLDVLCDMPTAQCLGEVWNERIGIRFVKGSPKNKLAFSRSDLG